MYSKDGWYSQFVDKDALKNAMDFNKQEALQVLSQILSEIFSNLGSGSKSTSNLIIAFEYAGIEKKEVLSMYKTGFEFIEHRLPDENKFNWKDIEKKDLIEMSQNEIAIVMLLTKMTNLDSCIQQDILFSINYLLNYDETLLIKPLKWFFQNINYFPHLSISALIEILILNVESKNDFLKIIAKDILSIKNIENIYIQHNITLLFYRLENV